MKYIWRIIDRTFWLGALVFAGWLIAVVARCVVAMWEVTG